MKLVIFSLIIFLTSTVLGQETKGDKYLSCLELININNDFIECLELSNKKEKIYFSFQREEIVKIFKEKLKCKHFKSYLNFSDEYIDLVKKEPSFNENYNENKPFKNIYLRFNFILNNDKFMELKESKDLFLNKFNKYVGKKISPYDSISVNDLNFINNRIIENSTLDSTFINQIEVPLLVFIGEYLIHKYGGSWKVKKGENILSQQINLPEIIFNGREMDISFNLFRYLYNPKFYKNEENFDIGAFIKLMEFRMSN